MSTAQPQAALEPGLRQPDTAPPRACYGTTLAVTVTLALATFLAVMAMAVLAAHPQVQGLGSFTGLVNQQNQTAKSLLYLLAFAVILPVSVRLAPRLADATAAGPDGPALAALVAGGLALALILLKLSPWRDRLAAVLVAVAIWASLATALLMGARRSHRAPASLPLAAGVLVFGVLLCLTRRSSLHVVPIIGALVVLIAVTALASRWRTPRIGPWTGRALEAVFVVLVALAVANVIVFRASRQLPNIYFPPGVIQNQQDYLLGSANQLLGGGALLVNVPVSQYGVGLVYLLDGWFHLMPIGYGTLGLLDSLLTALFYVCAYGVLRVAGVSRLLSAAATAVGVLGLIYALRYPVGSLPETGPLRFGLPMVLLAARTVQARWPAQRAAPATAIATLGIASIWAFEAFAYTALVFLAIAAVQTWLRPRGDRRPWLIRQLALGAGACITAHVALALATLAVSGHLPDWGQYLTYIHSFLLGGQAGDISYGFSNWSPGLAVAVGAFASAAALALLMARLPDVARREAVTLIALTGSTAYAVALLSYTDNRSSTYLLPYVALPLVIAGALSLALLRRTSQETSRAGTAFALALALLVIVTAWPSIGHNFAQSALARAYPGGGLTSAITRLRHPPPIDPRAPEGVRLLRRYVPGRRVLIVLPLVPDLGVEILMRGGFTNQMFIGDPVDDSLVPSLWMGKLTPEVGALRPGQRLLIDRDALRVLAGLRARPQIDPAAHPIDGGDQELEWLLKAIDRRFDIQPIYRDPDGLIVAQLAQRRATS